jgi:hypothetical protein
VLEKRLVIVDVDPDMVSLGFAKAVWDMVSRLFCVCMVIGCVWMVYISCWTDGIGEAEV